MKLLSRAVLIFAAIAANGACQAEPNASGAKVIDVKNTSDSFVAVNGRTITEEPNGKADPYWTSLVLESRKWDGGEPGNTSKVLKTKHGVFLFKAAPDRGTYLMTPDGKTVVMFYRNMDPDKVKPGESGQGRADETARPVTWEAK